MGEVQSLELWRPVPGLGTWFTIEGLYHDWEGLRVLLRPVQDNARVLRIAFDSCVAYRSMDESYRNATWAERVGEPLGSFVEVKGSRFLAEVVAEAGGVLDHLTLRHLAIHTIADCLDFIVSDEPVAQWL